MYTDNISPEPSYNTKKYPFARIQVFTCFVYLTQYIINMIQAGNAACIFFAGSQLRSVCQFPSDAELKKRGWGAHAEKVAVAGNVKMSVVRWFDNRPVTLCQLLWAPSLWEMSGNGTKPRKKKHSFHAHKSFQSTTNRWSVLICSIHLLGSTGAKFVRSNGTTASSFICSTSLLSIRG